MALKYNWADWNPTLLWSYQPPVSSYDDDIYKKIMWRPSGDILLALQENSTVNLFAPYTETPQLASFSTKEYIYDLIWISSQDSSNVRYVTSSKNSPVQLWRWNPDDNRHLEQSYRQEDPTETPESIISLACSLNGKIIYGGSMNKITIWDVESGTPSFLKTAASKRSLDGIQGIVSSIAVNPDHSDMVAFGTFSGCLGFFDAKSSDEILSPINIKEKEGENPYSVSSLLFSNDGKYLYSSHRKQAEILVWDIRSSDTPIEVIHRSSKAEFTNQRSTMDIDPSNRFLIVGNPDGTLNVYDRLNHHSLFQTSCHEDGISSVSWHPFYPHFVTCSGQRHFGDQINHDISIKLWYCPGEWESA